MFRRPKEERVEMDRLFDQGLTYKEIGQKFGLSATAVRIGLGRKPRHPVAGWRPLTVIKLD
jgi:DNA-directed RNA polymerase specialized sigma24 family protein